MALSNGIQGTEKRKNPADIILSILRRGAVSRTDLAAITGFSLTHIGRIVDRLLAEGKLIETETVAGSRGRPMTLLDINPDCALVAGFRLGPEVAEIAAANSKGEIQARKTVFYDHKNDSPEAMVDAIVSGIQRCCKTVGKDVRTLKGVGVSVAGLADPLLGVIDGLTNRKGWEGLPIAEHIERMLGVPVCVDNDVRAGALASQWLDNDAGEGGALYVYVSEGIGAVFVHDDGNLLRGVHDAACLLGHITVDPNGPLCGCGKHGCLEALACDVAFIRNVWPDKPISTSEMTVSERVKLVKHGVEMAKRGNARAAKALATVTRYLGIGIANAVCMFDPRTVSIFGTLVDIDSNMIIDMIRREALQHIWPRAKGVEIKPLLYWQEFLLRGSLGMVLLQPHGAQQDESTGVVSAESEVVCRL